MAPDDFDVLLLQPDNPPGSPGVYSALALVDNPLLGPFSVDFTFLGSGAPGAQPFFINQLDASGNLVSSEGGSTTPIPEPATVVFGFITLLTAGLARSTASRTQ
jgi:hypothetical protein